MPKLSKKTRSDSSYTAFGLSIILTIFLMILMPATQLWDADETIYARTAMEMVLSGNSLVPTFNGEYFSHKPPLVYWLMAISFHIFGPGEFAARFFSAPALGGAAFLTFLIGRHLFDHRVGLWAMIMLGSSLISLYLGSTAMLDAPLLFFITLAIYTYVNMLYCRQNYCLMLILFTIALSLSMLVKGPVGPAVICSTVLLSWFLMEKNLTLPFIKMIPLAVGAFIAVLVYLSWAIPANNQTDGVFLRESIGIHVIGRALAPMEGHGGSGIVGYFSTLLIYIPVIILGFMPWTLHLPAGFRGLYKGEIGDKNARALIWSWLIPTFLMFTFAATKLPHYIFPLWPALALLAASILVKSQNENIALLPGSKIGAWSYLVLSSALAILLLIGPFFIPDVIPFATGFFSGLIIIALTLYIFSTHMMGHVTLASKWLVIITPLIISFLFWVIVPSAEPYFKISKSIANAFTEYNLAKNNVYYKGYHENSLKFYVNMPYDKPMLLMPDGKTNITRILAKPDPMILIATQEAFNKVKAFEGIRKFEVLEVFSARNLNSGARLQKVVLARRK